MKRLFSTGVIIILLSIFGIINIQYFQKDSQLFTSNIEALAQVEHGRYIRCYDRITAHPFDVVRYCGNCDEIPGTWVSAMNFCIP